MRCCKNSVDWAEMYITDNNRKPWRATNLQKEILLNSDKVHEVYLQRQEGATEIITIDAMYNILTKSNITIGIISPYPSLNWDALMSKFKSNPEIEARLEELYGRSKRIVATNNSEIRIFDFEDVLLHGRRFDYLYVDCASYLPAQRKAHLDSLAPNRMYMYLRNE